MVTMFERFTQKGVKSIMIGQEEARRSGRDFVTCEDILVGMILENSSVAASVLDSFEINMYQIRRGVYAAQHRRYPEVID